MKYYSLILWRVIKSQVLQSFSGETETLSLFYCFISTNQRLIQDAPDITWDLLVEHQPGHCASMLSALIFAHPQMLPIYIFPTFQYQVNARSEAE